MNNKWYLNIKKSKLTPPSFVFGIVWPILYFLLGLSFFLVWKNDKCFPFCIPLIFFLIQLFFNLIWTYLFFVKKKFLLALIDIFIMIIFTIITIKMFYKIDKVSSYLLIPYLVWISFAFYLTFYIYMNN